MIKFIMSFRLTTNFKFEKVISCQDGNGSFGCLVFHAQCIDALWLYLFNGVFSQLTHCTTLWQCCIWLCQIIHCCNMTATSIKKMLDHIVPTMLVNVVANMWFLTLLQMLSQCAWMLSADQSTMLPHHCTNVVKLHYLQRNYNVATTLQKHIEHRKCYPFRNKA